MDLDLDPNPEPHRLKMLDSDRIETKADSKHCFVG